MKNIFLLLVTLFCIHTSIAQTNPASQTTTSQQDQPLAIAEEMPSFPGGNEKMQKFIQKNIKYPQAEFDAKVGGMVYINFIVEKDGSLTDIKVLRGVANAPDLDQEALRVIGLMPKWIPGKEKGQVVRVMFNLPIHFTPTRR